MRSAVRVAQRVCITALAAAACGPWQRVGSETAPAPGVAVPVLFDARPMYRGMGLFVAGPPVPFVGAIRYLHGGTPDSTLAIIALSLANQAFQFRREGTEFVARYRVEIVFSPDGGTPRTLTREEIVRVRSFQETLRADESVIFQQQLRLPPGHYAISVAVRDRVGTGLARAETMDTVPAFQAPMLAAPIPYYEGPGRSTLADLPTLVTNPRGTLPYGADSLRVYLEAYGVAPGTAVAFRVLDDAGDTVRTDTVAFVAESGFVAARYQVPPAALPVGRLDLEAAAPGLPAVRVPFLVSFSGQYVITNYEEMVNLLRYFDRQDAVNKLRTALPADRAKAWEQFWRESDPVPITPENEALEDYFRKVQQANLRFLEEGQPGWMTDRGEVFITIGEPDEVLDQSSGLESSGMRTIRWSYTQLRLVVWFEDESGFGRFRLTPSSRSEYQRVLARLRRGQ